MKKILSLYLFLAVFQPLSAQRTLTKKEKKNLVESVSKVLMENYVFLQVAKQLVEILESNKCRGLYDTIASHTVFAKQLTKDVQSINSDKHLRVLCEPERIKKRSKASSPQDSIKKEQGYLNWLRRPNYRFKDARILEGNISYVSVTRFNEPELAIPTTKEEALNVAYKKALENLIKEERGSDFYSKALIKIKEN
ncbi:hypothetical protein U6A24_04745 [Aquimarina gracilis]|uniref:Uncharacterized protein n=1 Tax=Aquimarina gracilis TaxID=874422 RepID=A0ABU5ZS47_9FLAO|nr:hypothetical protein [Aquimarina gracilis]MEB3344753.1 hypothetical protein [Aquimarina gracilis]